MKIGILTTGHRPEALPDHKTYSGMFRDLLDGQGFDFDNYDVVDGQFPASVEVADGWLITGSKHGAYDDLPWIAPLETLIRAAYAADIPMVGICFGHQIMAQALGGRVEKFSGGWSVGRVDYEFDGETLPLYAWHQDQVVARPPEAQIVSSTDFCENAALLYGNRAFTIQPHPEIDQTYLKGLLDTRAPGVVPETLQQSARARLGASTDSAYLAKVFALFFKEKKIA